MTNLQNLTKSIAKSIKAKPIRKIQSQPTQVIAIEDIITGAANFDDITTNQDIMETIELLATEYIQIGLNSNPALVVEHEENGEVIYELVGLKMSKIVYLASLIANEANPRHTQILVNVMSKTNKLSESVEYEAVLVDSLISQD